MGNKTILLKLGISLIAIIALASFIDVVGVASLIANFNLAYLPLIVLLIFANIFLYVANYWSLLKRKVPLLPNIKDYLVVWSFGLFLPGKLGELGIIPVLKKKYGVPYKFAALAVVAPKAAIFALLLLVLLYFGLVAESFVYLLLALVLLIAGLLFSLLVFKSRIRKIMLKNKVLSDIYNNRKEIRSMANAGNIFSLAIIAALRVASIVCLTYFLFIALGFEPQLLHLLVAISASQLISFIPVTLNGLGFREATFVGVMASLGVASTLSAGVVAVSLIVSYLLAVCIIALWNILGLK